MGDGNGSAKISFPSPCRVGVYFGHETKRLRAPLLAESGGDSLRKVECLLQAWRDIFPASY